MGNKSLYNQNRAFNFTIFFGIVLKVYFSSLEVSHTDTHRQFFHNIEVRTILLNPDVGIRAISIFFCVCCRIRSTNVGYHQRYTDPVKSCPR